MEIGKLNRRGSDQRPHHGDLIYFDGEGAEKLTLPCSRLIFFWRRVRHYT